MREAEQIHSFEVKIKCILGTLFKTQQKNKLEIHLSNFQKLPKMLAKKKKKTEQIGLKQNEPSQVVMYKIYLGIFLTLIIFS